MDTLYASLVESLVGIPGSSVEHNTFCVSVRFFRVFSRFLFFLRGERTERKGAAPFSSSLVLLKRGTREAKHEVAGSKNAEGKREKTHSLFSLCSLSLFSLSPFSKKNKNKQNLKVHYRNVDPERWDDVAAAVQSALADAGPSLRATRGRKVLEVRPAIDWDKGKALAHLLKALGLDKEGGEGEGEGEAGEGGGEAGEGGREGEAGEGAAPAPPSLSPSSALDDDDVVPLYLGDDRTDEDAFELLAERARGGKGGVGVLVSSKAKPSAARFSLRDPGEVLVFLSRLAAWGASEESGWASEEHRGGCVGWRPRLSEVDVSALPAAAAASAAAAAAASAEQQQPLSPPATRLRSASSSGVAPDSPAAAAAAALFKRPPRPPSLADIARRTCSGGGGSNGGGNDGGGNGSAGTSRPGSATAASVSAAAAAAAFGGIGGEGSSSSSSRRPSSGGGGSSDEIATAAAAAALPPLPRHHPPPRAPPPPPPPAPSPPQHAGPSTDSVIVGCDSDDFDGASTLERTGSVDSDCTSPAPR